MFKGFKLITSLLSMILLVGTISAWDWDNGIDYENDDITVVIKNAFGLPLIGEVLGKADLKSHTSVTEIKNVIGGSNRVPMYYDFYEWQEVYENGLGKVEFTDMKTGEKINKNYKFAYAIYEDYERPVYETSCTEEIINYPNESSTTKETCVKKIINYQTVEQFVRWEELTNKDIPKETTRIGVMVDVQTGEHTDAVWTIAGKKVSRHAEWTESLIVDLVAYWKMDDASGGLVDAHGSNDAVEAGDPTYEQAGKIGTSIDFDGTGDAFNTTLIAKEDGMSVSFWINYDVVNKRQQQGLYAEPNARFNFGISSTAKIDWGVADQDTVDGGASGMTAGNWYHVVITSNSSTARYYINTVEKTTFTGLSWGGDSSNNIYIGARNIEGARDNEVDGKIDEFGLWHRELSLDEVIQLYNSEDGITYVFIDTVIPEIDITYPQNITYTELITRINVTYVEVNPDVCWYSNDSGVTNSSGQSCDTNFTDLTYGQGSYNIITYINDTVGNMNQSHNITFYVDSIISINITTPANYTNTSDTGLDVNYSYIEVNPDSCWWTEDRGVTNTTITCGNNLTSETWSEGDHTIIIYIKDTLNNANSSSVFFTIDTKITDITIKALGNIEYYVKDTNLTINWTATDPFIDTCILEYSGVNTTFSCSRNYTEINITSSINKTVILWVNDTLGNVDTSSMSWDYYIFENKMEFNNETIEGSIESFSLNITKLGSITITAINLNYNNTNNLATFGSGDNILAEVDQTILNVVNITDITFYWEILLSNSTIIRSFNHTQQVKNISIDDCSAFTTLIYNYTLFDEEEQTILSGADLEVEIDFKVLSFDRSLYILNYSAAINGTNPVQICTSLPLNSTQYQADTILKYTNLGYAIEYYNIINFTLTNTTIPQNINLYGLNSSDSTEFQLTFTGSDFLPVENALVFVNRQYIPESVFKTVELPKTDSNGQTILHLVRNDVIYNIIIMKNGVVLGTFENLIAFCEDFAIGDCSISLNALSEVETIYNVDEDLGIVFTIPEYDETSREISFNYVSDDGTSKTVLMDVTRHDVFGNRSVCNDTLISAAGTLICTVGANIEDSTLRTTIYVNGDEITVTSTKIDKSNYGAAGYLIFFVMAISFIFMFSSSKTGVLFGIGLSFLAAVGLGLITGSVIGLGAAGLWLILILVLAIWKLNKERQQ